MVSYEFVKGLPVITMAEGRQIGKVDDMVVDPPALLPQLVAQCNVGLDLSRIEGERTLIGSDCVFRLAELVPIIALQTVGHGVGWLAG